MFEPGLTQPTRVELDPGLCRLSFQLTVNEMYALQAWFNSSYPIEFKVRIGREHKAKPDDPS